MKIVIKNIVAALFAAVLFAGGASAQTADISNTGPDSTNTITSNSSFECDIDNDTNIDLDFDNNQQASSGSATVSGNTSGGSATSGSANNSSSTDTSIGVINSNDCFPTAAPSGGGGGGGNVSGVSAGGLGGGQVLAESSRITALPVTGATSPAELIAGGVATLSGLAMAIKFGSSFRQELAF